MQHPVRPVWRECSFAFPQEDQHFANVVQGLEEPLETGDDGRAVLVPRRGIAACESAGTGRKVVLPFVSPCAPPGAPAKRPIELR